MYQGGYQGGYWGHQQPPPATTTVSTQPITNPRIPFIGSLPPVHDGLMIYMTGYVVPGTQQFHINLSMGSGYNGQVESALHIGSRQSTQEVVRNSYLGGYWGQEESGGPGFPFPQGHSFSMHIAITSEAFKIAVNGSHYCGFRHRVQKERITHLVIEGGVHVHSIQYQGQRPIPQPQGGYQQLGGHPSGHYPTGQYSLPGGYRPPPGGYPPQQPGGYPPQQPTGYPPQPGGYPPQQPGSYPPQPGGYPPQQPGGYPPQPGGYPPQQPGGHPPPPSDGSSYPKGPDSPPSPTRPPADDKEEKQPDLDPTEDKDGEREETEGDKGEEEENGEEEERKEDEEERKEPQKEEAEDETNTDEEEQEEETEPPVAEGDNLSNPYVVSVKGLSYGQAIDVGGIPNEDAEKFVIEVGYDHSKKRDIPFHMSASFPDEVVQRKTMINGRWGEPDEEQPCFPFKPEQPFTIQLEVEEYAYQIRINDNQFKAYRHRIRNIAKIRYLEVTGDITINSVKIH